MLLNKEQIMEIIPHRFEMLLIDEVEELSDSHCVAYKHLKSDDWMFRGHFPELPVMPGVLMCEALAQTGAVALLSREEFKGKIAFFGGIKNCRFKRKVIPGDSLRLEVTLTKIRGALGIGEAVATVNGEVAVSCELTFAIGTE